MTPDPNIPPLTNDSDTGNAPPVLSTPSPKQSWFSQRLMSGLLSICLGLFLADAVLSLADDILILLFNNHLLALVHGLIALPTALITLVVYLLMGLTPMIPKRFFVPITLFNPVAALLALWFLIYFINHIQLIDCIGSFFQLLLGLLILFRLQGGFKFCWPLVPEHKLRPTFFSWKNLAAFFLVNVVVLLPAMIIYCGFCAGLAVNHFSEGFMALHPGGFSVQMRKYVRNDGKTILLFPMAHIADADFYQRISQSFPTNSVILMEGVSDTNHLLTNKLSYKRMAKNLGLSEQKDTFEPSRGEMVRADVDVKQFSSETIRFLNLVTLFHARGLQRDVVLEWLRYAPPPDFQERIMNDILTERNKHLMGEINRRLSENDHLVVPWGVAHMPGIAEEIQKSGFHLEQTQDFEIIGFHPHRGKK